MNKKEKDLGVCKGSSDPKFVIEEHQLFVKIEDPNSDIKVWISKKNEEGEVYVNCSFDVMNFLPLVDAIEKDLGIEVIQASGGDSYYSYIICQVENGQLVELIDNLPDLLEKHIFQHEFTEA